MSLTTEQSPFWLVWNPNGHAPTVKHFSEHDAVTEAERLARLNPMFFFYVMSSVAMLRRVDVENIDMRPGSEIPF